MQENQIIQETYKIFLNNLNYLEKADTVLYNKLMLLEEAINIGKYTPKFNLEYINHNFDIHNANDDSLIYNGKIEDYSKSKINEITIDNISNTFNPYKLYKFSEKDLYEIQDRNQYPLFDSIFPTTGPIMNYVNLNAPIKSLVNKLYKFIFVGTGLGKHIYDIANSINAESYLIIEPDLEIFRLSLFVTKYYELAEKSNITFLVSYDDPLFKENMQKFASLGVGRNNNWKFSIFSENYTPILKKIQDFILVQTHLIYPFYLHFRDSMKTYHFWSKKFPFLNFSKVHDSFKYANKPFILIGAGPSLAKNIKLLQDNQHKFIIIAAYSTLTILNNNNIKPDIVVHLDLDEMNLATIKNLDSSYYKDIIFIFGITIPPKLSELLPKENIFFFQMLQLINNDIGNLVGDSIGDTIFTMLLLLNIKEIYLLGLDLALDPDTNKTYSDGHILDIDSVETDQIVKEGMNTSSFHTTTMPVKGNFRKNVYTISPFFPAINNMNSVIHKYKKETTTIYNLNDGAFFENTIPMEADYFIKQCSILNNINKQTLSKNLHQSFQEISTKKLSKKDIELINQKILHSEELALIISKFKTFSLPNNFNDYKEILNKLLEYLVNPHGIKNNDITLVLSNYLRYILHFIYEFFNKKDLINEEQHIINIHIMFSTALEDMVNEYLKQLNKFYIKLKKGK